MNPNWIWTEIESLSHDAARTAVNGATLTVQLAQARTPFRFEGAAAPGGATTAWWRTALDSPWTPWIVGGMAALAVIAVAAALAVKLLARMRSQQHSWTRIAAAMGLDRGERESLARLCVAAGLSQPAALLMSPSVFGAAIQSGGAALSPKDRATLLTLAARRDWRIPDRRPVPADSRTSRPLVEAKPLKKPAGPTALAPKLKVQGAAGAGSGAAPKKAAAKSSTKPATAASVGRRPVPVAGDRRFSA